MIEQRPADWHEEGDPDGFLLPEHDERNYVNRLAHDGQRTQPEAGVAPLTIFARLYGLLVNLLRWGRR